jgi:hypothetical protein
MFQMASKSFEGNDRVSATVADGPELSARLIDTTGKGCMSDINSADYALTVLVT